MKILWEKCFQTIDKISSIGVKRKKKKKGQQTNRLIRMILTGKNKMALKCHLGGVSFVRGCSRCCCYSGLHMRFQVFVIEFEIYIEQLASPTALYTLLEVDFSFQNRTVGP